MARGVDGRDIFTDDADRYLFMNTLRCVCSDARADILAHCLMGNHFHLAIKVSDKPLSAVLQRLLTKYSITFNARHDRVGHLFQARFKAILCLDDAYLHRLIRYIHENPVRAGLVSDSRNWPWSSRNQYLDDASDGMADFDPWRDERTNAPTLLRAEEKTPPPIDQIAGDIAKMAGIEPALLRSRSRRQRICDTRKDLTRRCIEEGHSLTAIARWMNRTASAIHHMTQAS